VEPGMVDRLVDQVQVSRLPAGAEVR
jgi:hypothetical protein